MSMSIVTSFLENAAKNRGREIVFSGGRSASLLDLELMSSKLASWLFENGASEKRTLAVFLADSIESLVSFLAARKTGARFLTLDPALPKEQVFSILREGEARWLISSKRYSELHREITLKVTSLSRTILIDEQFDDRSVSYKNILASYPSNFKAIEQTEDRETRQQSTSKQSSCVSFPIVLVSSKVGKNEADESSLLEAASLLFRSLSRHFENDEEANSIVVHSLSPASTLEGIVTKFVLPLAFSITSVIYDEPELSSSDAIRGEKSLEFVIGTGKELENYLSVGEIKGLESSPGGGKIKRPLKLIKFEWPNSISEFNTSDLKTSGL
jgi:hypothetical protein